MSPQAAVAARPRAAAAPAPAPLRRPIAPRRVSGPVRRPQTPVRTRSAIVRVLDAPVLDRLLRGRVWIAIVAVALFGIVAMQVTILRLGASIGASVTRIQQLEQANQNAATEIARLEPSGGVASKAAKLGMVYPPAGDVGYLSVRPGLAAAAAASISRPTAPLVVSAQSPALTAPLNTTTATTPTTPATATTPAATPAQTPTTPAITAAQQPAGTQTQSTTTGASTQAPPASTPPASASVGAAGGSAAPVTNSAGG